MRGVVVFGLSCAFSALLAIATYAQGTAFTYQGFLKQNGSPVNGSVSMTFRLYTAPTGGTLLGTVGPVSVSVQNGLFTVQLVAATGAKSFQIDHPFSPETHYLNHFCTEGPDPYNVYRGNVVTDANGYAVVQLPDYFEAINRDPTYHLTVIDNSDDFVLAKVVREIQNNQFVIRTSKPFVKVSWEIKAIRNDLWVQRYGYQTEQEKPEEHKGKYLHPELYGQPKEMGVHYKPEPIRPETPQKP